MSDDGNSGIEIPPGENTNEEQLETSGSSPLLPTESEISNQDLEGDEIITDSIMRNDCSDEGNMRKGTIASARFNILSTMVGGGSLSLPLAFHQAGNSLLAPLLLVCIAFLVQKSIHYLVQAAILSHPEDDSKENQKSKGNKSFDSVASAAFGDRGKYGTMALLATICFLTIVGYTVLLRDMLLPFSDLMFGKESSSGGPTFYHNITMLTVVFLVTPLCTLRDLTPLEKVGALSMTSIFAVACCIAFRSAECNFSSAYDSIRHKPWYEYINFVPSTSGGFELGFHDLFNALPILISVFMCHFNILPVHNEFSNPTPKRVKTLFASSIWGACLFYLFVGFSGSMYGNCTPEGTVEGNVLLSFDDDDVLLIVCRLCLSLTITAAFPILVVPCRDVIMRAMENEHETEASQNHGSNDSDSVQSEGVRVGADADDNYLAEPLLPNRNHYGGSDEDHDIVSEQNDAVMRRRIVSIVIFWAGAIVGCCVESIDVVWDVLGGSLSLLMGFIIPSASYIVISKGFLIMRSGSGQDNSGVVLSDEEHLGEHPGSLSSQDGGAVDEKFTFPYFLLLLFTPMIFLLTTNAIYNLS
jgi:amino acid permease